MPERFAMVHGHGLFQGRLASGPNGVAVSHFPSAVGLTCPFLSFLPPFLLPVTMSLLLRVLTRHVLPAGAAIGSSALRYDRIVESRRLREKETSARNPSADVGRSVLFFHVEPPWPGVRSHFTQYSIGVSGSETSGGRGSHRVNQGS